MRHEERIKAEAIMTFLKHKIEWLESFIENRQIIRDTGTGTHLPQVEDHLIELTKDILNDDRRNFEKLKKKYRDRHPYSELPSSLLLETEA